LLGFISFGGPAGQIAILHREVVERRRWIGEREFTDALNFCMFLPGPEALQLAIYIGWRLHGARGGLMAGLGFILPAVVLLFTLSYLYVLYGHLPALSSILFGLKAAVIALVGQALVRIGRRALRTPLHAALAVGAFLALGVAHVPFPVVLLVAAIVGAATARSIEAPIAPLAAKGYASTLRVIAVGLVLWAIPWGIVVAILGRESLFSTVYLFFTKAALVTFGGAYAVLGYVTTELVNRLQWITAPQSVAGLALAETTPGPLVIVLQFMGFMTGWNQPGTLGAVVSALLAGALASWATFLPSFVFIFAGAPHIEHLTRRPRIGAALAAITAAVVGVIATLALLLVQVVCWPAGWLHPPDWPAIVLAAVAWLALERLRWPLPLVLAGCAVAGLLVRWLWLLQ
jgi:chromate transporter